MQEDFYKKQTDFVQLNVRIPKELRNRLDGAAGEERRSQSSMVQVILEQYLDDYEQQKKRLNAK